MGGTRLHTGHAEHLELMWAEHLKAVAEKPDVATSEIGTGMELSTDIERGYAMGTVRRSNHQRKLRRLLLSATDEPQCFVCDFYQVDLLEAAHIIADIQSGASNMDNGRLMCTNQHRAHDKGMFWLENDQNVWNLQAFR